MKKLKSIIISTIVLILFSSFSQNKRDDISLQSAIQLAEKFIAENGFTKAKPDRKKIKYELFEDKTEIDQILKSRYNTLHPKAFCYLKDNEWNIGFLLTEVNLTKLNTKSSNSDLPGRAIIVAFNGKEIMIAHKDPRFSYFTKLN